MKDIMVGIGVLILLIAIVLGVRYASLHTEKFFGPKEANVKREIFEETKGFNEGKMQQLSKYKYEYSKAKAENDKVAMKAIKSSVRHQFADYDRTKLPAHLQAFINETERY